MAIELQLIIKFRRCTMGDAANYRGFLDDGRRRQVEALTIVGRLVDGGDFSNLFVW